MRAAATEAVLAGRGIAEFRSARDAWCLYVLVAGTGILVAYAIFSLFDAPGIGGPLVVFLLLALSVASATALRRRPIETVIFLSIVVLLAVLAVYSLIREWDVRSIWFFHAKQIYYGAGPRDLLDGYRHQAHPDYPKIFPLVVTGVARIAGIWNEALPKLGVPLLLSVPLACLWAAVGGPARRLLLAVAIFLVCGRFLWSGMADGILAVSGAAAYCALVAFREGGKRADGLCFVLLSALMVGLKAEGALAVAALGVALACGAVAPRHLVSPSRAWRKLILPGAVCLALVLTWQLRVALIGAPGAGHFEGDVAARVANRLTSLDDLGRILDGLFLRKSLLVLIVAAVALGLLSRGPARRANLSAAVFAVVFSAALLLVYAATPHDLGWHLRTSVERVVQLPQLVLLTGMILSLCVGVRVCPSGRRPAEKVSASGPATGGP